MVVLVVVLMVVLLVVLWVVLVVVLVVVVVFVELPKFHTNNTMRKRQEKSGILTKMIKSMSGTVKSPISNGINRDQ
jgi:Flp pilus assembly protein TadB